MCVFRLVDLTAQLIPKSREVSKVYLQFPVAARRAKVDVSRKKKRAFRTRIDSVNPRGGEETVVVPPTERQHVDVSNRVIIS